MVTKNIEASISVPNVAVRAIMVPRSIPSIEQDQRVIHFGIPARPPVPRASDGPQPSRNGPYPMETFFREYLKLVESHWQDQAYPEPQSFR